MARASYCNVLELDGDKRRFWRFGTGSGNSVSLGTDKLGGVAEPARRKYAAKSWSALWQPKLNVAWLPVEQVFLRVLQLPKCDFAELHSMVEFQLDRISPLPLTQIVWSLEVIPHKGATPTDTQTVLVLIASKHVVEEHLGRLEGDGYLPDRVEPPFLHQLLATDVKQDGIWIYPQTAEAGTYCLVAWWYGSALQNLSLVHFTAPENWGTELDDEVRKAAWAGELEGWMTAPPKWHLVAEPAAADAWLPALQPLTDRPVEVVKPMDATALAIASARGAAHELTRANLVPVESSARYHQRFIDGLWIRGLGAALTIYLLAVAGYFSWLEYIRYQKNEIEEKIAALDKDYSKVQELKARIAVQQEQIALRYAALDCLRAAAELLPEGARLKTFAFSGGSQLTLSGEASRASVNKLNDYTEALGKYEVDGKLLFENVSLPTVTPAGPANSTWSLRAQLKGGGV